MPPQVPVQPLADFVFGIVCIVLITLPIALGLLWLGSFIRGWGWTAGALYARERSRRRKRYHRRERLPPVDLSAYEDLEPLK